MPAETRRVTIPVLVLIAAATTSALTTVHVGKAPPDFTVHTAIGAVPLSQLRGKPVILNFWASWCPPCTDELPYFQRAMQAYGNRIVVVTVSNEAAGVARAYLQQHKFELPVMEDPDGKVFSAYAIPPIPGTVVLDASGNVAYISAGGLSWQELQSAIDRVLARETRASAVQP